MAARGVGRTAKPWLASPVLRALLRCGLSQQLSPEHLLGAWSGARGRGGKAESARPLPEPPQPLSPRGGFFPQYGPRLICLPLPARAATPAAPPPAVSPPCGLGGSRPSRTLHRQGPPQKVFLTLSRSGKGVSRQPVPVALVVVDSSASWKDPQAMFAVRT